MLNIIRTRIKQEYQTIGYPAVQPVLPELYQGKPEIENTPCLHDCRRCTEVCPTQAISATDDIMAIDLGKCIFCNACEQACPYHKIHFTRDFQLSAGSPEDLIISSANALNPSPLNLEIPKLFGRSLKLRQVSAGGCGACEADTNVLNTIVFDLSRFGIQFVASPRHADGLLITGPVTHNMELALLKTYEALASPKVVIVVGACAISGGIYAGHPQANDGIGSLLPVDLYIPGCPPHPLTILNGLLRLIGKIR